jgi:hypothetical protein
VAKADRRSSRSKGECEVGQRGVECVAVREEWSLICSELSCARGREGGEGECEAIQEKTMM